MVTTFGYTPRRDACDTAVVCVGFLSQNSFASLGLGWVRFGLLYAFSLAFAGLYSRSSITCGDCFGLDCCFSLKAHEYKHVISVQVNNTAWPHVSLTAEAFFPSSQVIIPRLPSTWLSVCRRCRECRMCPRE
jgi:hypothetical protein